MPRFFKVTTVTEMREVQTHYLNLDHVVSATYFLRAPFIAESARTLNDPADYGEPSIPTFDVEMVGHPGHKQHIRLTVPEEIEALRDLLEG